MSVKILENILPVKTNLELLRCISYEKWEIAKDACEDTPLNVILQKPTGFLLRIVEDRELKINTRMLIYSNIILNIVCEKLNIKNFDVDRVFWNLYTPLAYPSDHKDNESSDYLSLLYSPHTTDGGTEIDGKFYPDKMGQAKLFKSNTLHKGCAPKKDLARFNLNIVFKEI